MVANLLAAVLVIGGVVLLALALSALFAWPVWWLYNLVIPGLLGWPALAFWQVWALLTLIRLLMPSRYVEVNARSSSGRR